jgi:hypothetical protein
MYGDRLGTGRGLFTAFHLVKQRVRDVGAHGQRQLCHPWIFRSSAICKPTREG